MSRYATIQAIWAEVPSARCKGLCGSACGPIGLYGAETAAMEQAGYSLPVMVPRVPATRQGGAFKCSHLDEASRCAAYDVRPLICRLWGVVKALRCPYGCRPKNWLGEQRVTRLFELTRALDPSVYSSAAGRVLLPGGQVMRPATWGDDGDPSDVAQALAVLADLLDPSCATPSSGTPTPDSTSAASPVIPSSGRTPEGP